MADLPNLGAQLVLLLIELCYLFTGLFGLENLPQQIHVDFTCRIGLSCLPNKSILEVKGWEVSMERNTCGYNWTSDCKSHYLYCSEATLVTAMLFKIYMEMSHLEMLLMSGVIVNVCIFIILRSNAVLGS